MFVYFTSIFTPNIYNDEEFLCLEYGFVIIHILLKYHDPELFLFLFNNGIFPELYATSWLLTIFSHKQPLEVVYKLWDFLICSGLEFLVYFIVIALIINNRNKIISANAICLPQTVSSLTIGTIEELNRILDKAFIIMVNTPEEFIDMKIRYSCIFNPEISKDETRKMLEEIEKSKIMTITTEDLLSRAYKNYCQHCIRKKQEDVQDLNSSPIHRPRSSFVKTSAISSNKILNDNQLLITKYNSVSSVENIEEKNLKIAKGYFCKNCKGIIPETIIVELLKPKTNRILISSILVSPGQDIKDIIANHKGNNDSTVVLLAEKEPETLKSNIINI